jgi:hypothetical protein
VANLWNTLYFSWHLDEKGYLAETIDSARIPEREMNAQDSYLPIGGFVSVLTKTRVGNLWAEVVYKEGAHPEISFDWIDPTLSGAREAMRRELFVLDFDAFQGLNCVNDMVFQRILRKGRWLDENGHLVAEGLYPEQRASLEDIDYYIHYLLQDHREGLLAFCFREEISDEELHKALLLSFEAVRELAEGCRELCSWRGKYFFASKLYSESLFNRVMGEGDLLDIYRGLLHMPSGESVAYSAIGPRILELLERQGGLDEEERRQLRGPFYAAAVCYANVFVRDTLAREAHDGLINGELHLRLDDDWQGGGIWRCERTAGRISLRAIPATTPLGLGSLEATPLDEFSTTDAEPISESMHSFRVALNQRDLVLGRFRIPARIVTDLSEDNIAVRIVYGAERDTQFVFLDRSACTIQDISWPLTFYPGLVLYCSAEHGGSVIRARAQEKIPPLVIDGQELNFDTVLSLYDQSKKRLSEREVNAAPSMIDLVHRAFQQYGRETDDGARALTLSELVEIILGPAWEPQETKPITHALAELELERRGADYLWVPKITERTRASEQTLLKAYGEGAESQLRRVIRPHHVPAHLRKLQGRQKMASPDKLQTYAEARQKLGRYGIWPPDLPEGYTWVIDYERGGYES